MSIGGFHDTPILLPQNVLLEINVIFLITRKISYRCFAYSKSACQPCLLSMTGLNKNRHYLVKIISLLSKLFCTNKMYNNQKLQSKVLVNFLRRNFSKTRVLKTLGPCTPSTPNVQWTPCMKELISLKERFRILLEYQQILLKALSDLPRP